MKDYSWNESIHDFLKTKSDVGTLKWPSSALIRMVLNHLLQNQEKDSVMCTRASDRNTYWHSFCWINAWSRMWIFRALLHVNQVTLSSFLSLGPKPNWSPVIITPQVQFLSTLCSLPRRQKQNSCWKPMGSNRSANSPAHSEIYAMIYRKIQWKTTKTQTVNHGHTTPPPLSCHKTQLSTFVLNWWVYVTGALGKVWKGEELRKRNGL